MVTGISVSGLQYFLKHLHKEGYVKRMNNVVITSYSIHYTKLYEIVIRPGDMQRTHATSIHPSAAKDVGVQLKSELGLFR